MGYIRTLRDVEGFGGLIKLGEPFWGVPIMRTIVFGGVYISRVRRFWETTTRSLAYLRHSKPYRAHQPRPELCLHAHQRMQHVAGTTYISYVLRKNSLSSAVTSADLSFCGADGTLIVEAFHRPRSTKWIHYDHYVWKMTPIFGGVVNESLSRSCARRTRFSA